MKNRLLILTLLIALQGMGQNLKTFAVTMEADSVSYLSIKNQKVYSPQAASAVKTDLDLGLFKTDAGTTKITEWYNLRTNNEKVPASLTGTTTAIAAISFDGDQFNQCRTSADLKRMAGHITTNSLSHFAAVRHSSQYYQRCFIIERANGKRGLLYITELENGRIKVEVKTE
jgi:hypothetical protein